jgi:hypothetical protein
MPMQNNSTCDSSLRRLMAVAAVACVLTSAVIAPAALAKQPAASSSPPPPLSQAIKDTNAAAEKAVADYKIYKRIQCSPTGTDAGVGTDADTGENLREAKKDLKRANKEVKYAISNEARASPDVVAAQAAEDKDKAQMLSASDHPGAGLVEAGTARKIHKTAAKSLKTLMKERQDDIRIKRLAGYAFGDPDPQCKVAPGTSATLKSHSKKQPVPAPPAAPPPTT